MTGLFVFVLIALISLGVGVAIGVMITGFFSGKPQETSLAKSQPNLIETARLLQDRKTGNLVMEVNGKIIRNPADLSPSQRERLSVQIQTLHIWFSHPQNETESALTAKGIANDTSQSPADYITPVPPATQQPSRLGPIDLIARSIQPDSRQPAKQPQSIAAQIDEILQDKLTGSPFAERGIRLMELPSKGLVVMVGLDQYEDVDAVPDPEIRSLIRESVTEWEQRSTQD